jgi:hypothetical protein
MNVFLIASYLVVGLQIKINHERETLHGEKKYVLSSRKEEYLQSILFTFMM